MRIPVIFFLTFFISFQTFAQADKLPTLDQFTGYYDVGVRPNKPFFKSRWYLKDGRLFTIYDSDIDREFVPFKDGKLAPTVFLSEEDVEVTDTDSTYYLVLNFQDEQLQSFRVIRPRKIWPTDLYGYRNKELSELAVDTEKELTYSLQTDHFSFQNSQVDSSLIPTIAERLEENFEELITEFGLEDFPLTTIRIYPDLNTYHNAVLTPGAPQWQMGRAWDKNEIRMLSTVEAEEILNEPTNAYEMIVHELIHCIHLSKIPDTQNAPGWLWEGIAVYKGCCQWTDSPYEIDELKKGKRPSLKAINRDRISQLKYSLGYYLIEYIEATYGWGKVLDLIKTNGDIKKSLNVSVKNFEKQFYAYLEATYGQ